MKQNKTKQNDTECTRKLYFIYTVHMTNILTQLVQNRREMTIRTSARKPKNQTKCSKEEQRWGEYGGRTDKERRRKKGSSRTFRFNIGQFNNLSGNVCVCINIILYFLHLFPRFPFPVFDQSDNKLRGVILVSLNLPVQLVPFPINPPLHLHWKSPMVLIQVALE